MKKLNITSVLIILFTYSLFAQSDEISIHFETNYDLEYLKIDTSFNNNSWQIGEPQKTIFNSAYYSEKAILTDTLNYYSTNDSSLFVVGKRFNSYGKCVPELRLSFFYKYNTDTLLDGGMIEFSFDSITWYSPFAFDTMPEIEFYHFDNDLYTVNDSVESLNAPGFSGNSNGWNYFEGFFMGNFLVEKFEYYVKFTYSSDNIQTNKDGWMIDNININYFNGANIEKKYNNDFIQVFPNPCTDNINIYIKNLENENFKIQLIDISGKVIFNKKTTCLKKYIEQIEMSPYPKGIYFIKVIGEKTYYSGKIIKL